MEPEIRHELPFTTIHYEGLDGLFPEAGGDPLIDAISRFNPNAEAMWGLVRERPFSAVPGSLVTKALTLETGHSALPTF